MRIQIDVALHYRFTRPNTVLLAIEAGETDGQRVLHQSLEIDDWELCRIPGDAGVGKRSWARGAGCDMRLAYSALVEISRQDTALDAFDAAPLHAIPGDVAPYLRPSRYCQSDKFVAFVQKRFGHLAGGGKVAAMRDWVRDEVSYVPGSPNADTTVLETFASREGVCRDYAHLICTMARAAHIPARMAAVYGPDVTPPDFHAVAEVWLGGAWRLVDPSGMSKPDALAFIAVGRDAHDVAFMDSEAPAEMLGQSVRVSRA